MVEYDAHRWRDHLLDIQGSMLREILYRVLSCVLFSAVVVALDQRVAHLGISDKAHGLIGVALGLLLVFRTNAAYDRFWEGRKQWGTIVNTCRNLARATRVLLAADPALVEQIIRWTALFPTAAMNRLRQTPGLGEAGDGLPPAEVAAAAAARHTPLWIAKRISELLLDARRRGLISDYVHMSLEGHVHGLMDQMGGSERIQNTPIPFAYVVHLRRALILYCFTLPLALLPTFGVWTVAVTLVLAYILFGIEEIGVEISDPFGRDDNDLPLENICLNIRRDLHTLLPEPNL